MRPWRLAIVCDARSPCHVVWNLKASAYPAKAYVPTEIITHVRPPKETANQREGLVNTQMPLLVVISPEDVSPVLRRQNKRPQRIHCRCFSSQITFLIDVKESSYLAKVVRLSLIEIIGNGARE